MSNAQSKLEAMKAWSANRLAAATAKFWTHPPKPFVADLRQYIPRVPMTTLTAEAHRAWLFDRRNNSRFKPKSKITAYVKAWDEANHFVRGS